MTQFFAATLIIASILTPGLSGNASARTLPPATQPETSGNRVPWVAETGIASYYGPVYHGRRAADGSRFDQMALTAAHPWLPFGTKVLVTLAGTDRSVVVTITDRLHSARRIVDLSLAAARRIGIVHSGLGQVTLRPA
jgi:rare lipoprotein A